MFGHPEIGLDNLEPFANGLDHPECVAFAPDGFIYAGGEAGQIYRVSLESGSVEQIGTTGGFTLGVAADADSNIYSCDMVNQAVMRTTQQGVSSVYSSGSADRPMICPNYATFAADGTLYVSDSGDWAQENGCIWRVAAGGEAEVLVEDVRAHSNGLALHPDGGWLYCAESLRRAIVRVPLDAEGRAAGPTEVVLPLPTGILADGLAFAADGSLLIACYSPDVILRLDPEKKLTVLAADEDRVVLASPTNVAFAGPDLKTLVIAGLARWHLTRVELEFAGAPLHYPRVMRDETGEMA